jgi:hypothetical protein
MTVKNLTSTHDRRIRHDGGVWTISCKDFPATETFRVYRIEGDINRLEDLNGGIIAMLTEHGIERRTIELNF